MKVQRRYASPLIAFVCFLIFSVRACAQSSLPELKAQFLHQQYDQVLLPLVQLKSSGPSNFELDYMIAVSLCETDGNLKDGQDYFVAMSREYPTSKRWFDGKRVDLAQVAQGICNFRLVRATAPTGGGAEVGGKADTPERSAGDRTASTQKSSGQIADRFKNKQSVKSNRDSQKVP